MAKVSRKIGLAALTVLELSHEEQVSVAAQAGYSHVGLRLIPVAGQPVIHALDAAEVERRLADTGVGVLDVEVFRLMPQTNVGEFEAVMATAQRLGATELLVHGADSSEARLIETWAALRSRRRLRAVGQPGADALGGRFESREGNAHPRRRRARERRPAGRCDSFLSRGGQPASAGKGAAQVPALYAALRRAARAPCGHAGDHPPGALRSPVSGPRWTRFQGVAARLAG